MSPSHAFHVVSSPGAPIALSRARVMGFENPLLGDAQGRFCLRFASALTRPSAVLGPVDMPPWSLQRLFASGLARQG